MHTQSEHLPFCTCARPPIWHQGVPFAAATFVASFRIRALRVAASVHYHALINICENITTTLLVRAIPPPLFLKRVFLFKQIKLTKFWIFSPHPPPPIHSCWFITVPLVFLSSFPFRQCFIWHLFSSTNLWLKNSETQYKMKYTQTEI